MNIEFKPDTATASAVRMNGYSKIGEASVTVGDSGVSVSMISSKSATPICWFNLSHDAAREFVALLSAMLSACPACGGHGWKWGTGANSGKHEPCAECKGKGMRLAEHPDTDEHRAGCVTCITVHDAQQK